MLIRLFWRPKTLPRKDSGVSSWMVVWAGIARSAAPMPRTAQRVRVRPSWPRNWPSSSRQQAIVPRPVDARVRRRRPWPHWATPIAPTARPIPLMASRMPNWVGPSTLIAEARLMASTYSAASRLYSNTSWIMALRTLLRSFSTWSPSPISPQMLVPVGWRAGSLNRMRAIERAAIP